MKQLSEAFEKLGLNYGAKGSLILSQLIATSILAYFITAMVKVMKLKLPVLILGSVYFVTLVVGCGLLTEWVMSTMKPYDGYCELSYNFVMPWLALLFSTFGLLALNINLYLLNYINLK